MCFTYNSGNYIYFGFPYLTFKQEYECRHDASAPFIDCDIEEVICPAREQSLADFEYRVNIDADYYLNNWFVEMDLMCESKVRTNIMVSARYIAFGIAGALLFAVPDRWGRKKSLLLAATVNTMANPFNFGLVTNRPDRLPTFPDSNAGVSCGDTQVLAPFTTFLEGTEKKTL